MFFDQLPFSLTLALVFPDWAYGSAIPLASPLQSVQAVNASVEPSQIVNSSIGKIGQDSDW